MINNEKKKIIFDLEEFKDLVNWIEREKYVLLQSDLRKLNFKIVKENSVQRIIDKEKLLEYLRSFTLNNFMIDVHFLVQLIMEGNFDKEIVKEGFNEYVL